MDDMIEKQPASNDASDDEQTFFSQMMKILKAQLSKLLREEVFQNLRFSTLYNECRYPRFDSRTNTYSVVHITKIDCKRVADMNMLLDKYMCGFDRL